MNVDVKPQSSTSRASGHLPMSFPPTHPGGWAQYKYERLFELSWRDYHDVQLAALQHRFAQLKDAIPALDRLAKKQGVTHIDKFGDALPLFFDHRVYKSYPLNLIEERDFPKLTSWFNRLTLHDLTKVDLTGLTTLDSWVDRLEDFGMIIGHSTGTTGKLSFIPRSKVEWPAWDASYSEVTRASFGLDPKKDFIPTFFPGYRGGHQMMMKMQTLFSVPSAGGWDNYYTMYQTKLSSDLMSLAGRLQSAEDKGDLERLALDPVLLEKRKEMIEQGRRRDKDLEAWFEKLFHDFAGKRVRIGGTFADLARIAVAGKGKGLKSTFAPGSILVGGGGMKGYKDAPADWEDQVKSFFGIDRIRSLYGMSEIMGMAPQCSCGHFHFMPVSIPILVDKDAKELPRKGVQVGRLAVFDLIAETYWGGFISGDQITMHWDEDCPCGWKGPYLEKTITRFAEMEGGDDKITCAGSAQAYNEFMEYVMQV